MLRANQVIELIAKSSKREILRYNSLFKNTVDNWGVVTCGEELITGITGTSSGNATLDLSGWGFTSVDDYEIFTTVKNNYSAISARTWVEKLSAASASIGAITGQGDAVGVYYVIVAKGFGGGSGGGGSITIDDALSETSTNPIQNRVLYGVFESQRQVVEDMQQRIEALENKLNKYSDIPLTLTDGTNTVDRVVLGKLPSKFDIPAGGYDAEGNLVMTGEQVAALMTTGIVGSQQTPYWSILDAISLDSRVKGIVLPKKKGDITPTSIGGSGGSIATFINYATDNQFDYVVLPDTVTSIWCDRFANQPTAVKTLYYRGSNIIGNPWGMTNMIIDTEG